MWIEKMGKNKKYFSVERIAVSVQEKLRKAQYFVPPWLSLDFLRNTTDDRRLKTDD